jgi:hypothetical protein
LHRISTNPIQRALSVLLWLSLLLAAVVFFVRGPLRSSSGYVNDFAAPYTSARLWLQNKNPYDPALFWQEWHRAGAPPGPVYANPSSTHAIYPPPSLIVLAPLAVLPWHAAWSVLQLLSVTAYLVSLLLLARLLPGTWRQPAKPVFLLIGLLFAPAQSALHVSNVSCLSASLLFFTVYLCLNPSPDGQVTGKMSLQTIGIAGLVVLSLCLKPTLAPMILLYLLVRRLWISLALTIGLGSLSAGIFLLLKPAPAWLPSLRANIDFLFTSGVASLGVQNLTRSDRLDLQLPAFLLTHNAIAASGIALVTTLALTALWWSKARHLSPTLDDQLLSLSTLLLLGLLPFYQRFYSATLLLLPILWALRNLADGKARWCLALCCLFVANTSVLPRLLNVHFTSASLISRLPEALVVAHLNWIILALAVLLLQTSTSKPDAEHS